MAPKINPNIKIELKDGAFALTDTDTNQTKPIDPLAVFVCSLCDGTRDVATITTTIQEKLIRTGQPIPENLDLQEQVQKIVNILSQEGVLFLQ